MNKAILLTSLIFVLFLSTIPISLATSTQWFPDANTQEKYQLSMYVRLNNGTIYSTSRFDVLNVSFSSSVFIDPLYLKNIYGPQSIGKVIDSNTDVYITHKYFDASSTQLGISTIFQSNQTNFTNRFMEFYLLTSTITVSTGLIGQDTNTDISKINFPSYSTHDFWDYLDISAGIGNVIFGHYHIATITPNVIVADSGNSSYIADATTGQVISYSNYLYIGGAYTGKIAAEGYTLTRVDAINNNQNSFSIPGYSVMLIGSIAALTISYIIIKLKKQRNLYDHFL